MAFPPIAVDGILDQVCRLGDYATGSNILTQRKYHNLVIKELMADGVGFESCWLITKYSEISNLNPL